MELDLGITFGAIAPFMSDPTIEEIWINSPERIFIARNGRSELTNLLLSQDDVRNIVERALMWSGRRLDLSHPFVDARLPDGSRLHVVIPEITAHHWAVNIRKHLMRNSSVNDLVDLGVMTAEIGTALIYCVQAGLNILVSGGTQAGKTTVLNALAGAIPRGERVVTIEEVFELSPQLPDVVQMQTRSANLQGEGEIPLRRLIKESLRMRPSRIIVGEVREAEALDLLIALNSGLPGMASRAVTKRIAFIVCLLQKHGDFVASVLIGSSRCKQYLSSQVLRSKSLHRWLWNMQQQYLAGLKVIKVKSMAQQLKGVQSF